MYRNNILGSDLALKNLWNNPKAHKTVPPPVNMHVSMIWFLHYGRNYAVFFRSFVRFTLPAVAVLVAALGAATFAFACLLASIAFFRFSGNPLFFAALLLALVNDFAAKGVRIVKPYFFLYSFWLMLWKTRCFVVSCLISFLHSRQITLSFWMESAGLSTGFSSVGASPATSAVGANSIPPASAPASRSILFSSSFPLHFNLNP